MSEEALLQRIVADPASAAATWLVLADWLEEHDDPRAELVRLCHDPHFRRSLRGAKRAERVRQLLAAGVRPCVPTCTNSLGMRFVWCPPGTFLMGSPPKEEGRFKDERRHRVTLTRGCYLGVTPVTQAQWHAVMHHHPGRFNGNDWPVKGVSWEDCQGFCERLFAQSGQRYRLPTEAEWEYACRAGTTTPYHFGATISTDQANVNGDLIHGVGRKNVCRHRTMPVGRFPPNAWGLYDMHGNVWEWCQDWYRPYPKTGFRDPLNGNSGDARVIRGGSWINGPVQIRAASRCKSAPGRRSSIVGCRVVLC